MAEPLAPELFRSRGTPALARSLLGKLLVRVSPDGVVHRHRIVEVEAYHGAAAEPASGLYLEDDGLRVPRALIHATPRIGVDYAGPVWAAKPWRFFYDPSELVVRPGRRRARRGNTPA